MHPERPNAGGGVGALPYLADLFSTKIKFHYVTIKNTSFCMRKEINQGLN